jgi:hypothetical protein
MRLEVAAKPPEKAGIACANTPLPPLLLKISHADDEEKGMVRHEVFPV